MLLSLKIALQALATHKLRTALAMLGVFLGALALTTVRHVAEAMERQAEIEVEKFGPNLVAVLARPTHLSQGDQAQMGPANTLQLEDCKALADSIAGVVQIAPMMSRIMPIRAGNTTVKAQLLAVPPNYPSMRNFQPALGRFFSPDEERARAKVIVLGPKIAQRLFGDPAKAVGQVVYMEERAALVVLGVMEEKGADVSGTDQDEQVFVPLSTYMRRMANQTWVGGVFLQMTDGADFKRTKAQAVSFMRARHNIVGGKLEDFSVLTAEDTQKLKQQALDLVSVLGLISSTLSFAVGGLGILSMMILLVRARRLEIGVRRAMGARRRDIVSQFLLEAGVMSVAGGAAGVLAALAILTVVYRVGEFPYVYDGWLIAQALAGSALLGLAAGAYPAWQAAHVEVLKVLRDRV
jgi:putative ABC transport system permease protein